MKKFCLTSGALALAAILSFLVGSLSRQYATVEGQARGKVFPKVEIHVLIDGIEGGFRAGVSGLGATCEVIEELDAKTNRTRKRPGRVKYGDITLKKGFLEPGEADGLYRWYEDVTLGRFERKDGSIVLVDGGGTEVARYAFFEAWPCKWKGVRAPNADAAFPTEEIGLVVQKVQKVQKVR